MAQKILALNDKGQLTYCTVPPEERGKGRCNHIAHQEPNETREEFIERVNNERVCFSREVLKGEMELEPYRMTDEEKANLVKIEGRKQLEDKDNEGGYIELDQPLWNDVDKQYFAQLSKNSVKNIQNVIDEKSYIVVYVEKELEQKYKIGQIFKKEVAENIKEKFGDLIFFGTGVESLNIAAKKYDFEATKDIYVLPYYLRQDPPDGEGKNPLNTLYNYVIYNRKDIQKQQKAYESLLDNKSVENPLTQRGGYAIDSLADQFKGKSGLLRGFMSGRRICYSGRAVISPDIEMKYGYMRIPPHIICDIYKPTLEDIMKQRGKSDEEIENFLFKFKGRQDEISESDRKELEEMIVNSGVKVIANRQPSLHQSSLLAFRPLVSPDATIHLNPLNCPGQNADFDGDTNTIYGLNDVHIAETAEKEFGAATISGTKRPRALNQSIIMPEKEAKWGLLNILSKRTN